MSTKAEILNALYSSNANESAQESTLQTYSVYLHNLLKRLHTLVSPFTTYVDPIDFLQDDTNTTIIIDFINNHSAYTNIGSRSVLFSALYKLSGLDCYREQVEKLRGDINSESIQQKQLPQRAGKELSQEDINYIHRRSLVDYLSLNHNDPFRVTAATNALITGLMTGVYAGCPPRRLQEYLELQLHGTDPNKNHFNEDKTMMVFNKHKNSKWTGPESLPFPVELRGPLEFLAGIRPKRQFLLMNNKNEQFTKGALSNKLTRKFGFSVDMMRSLFITDHNKGAPALLDNMQLAKAMGHSVRTQHVNYTKK